MAISITRDADNKWYTYIDWNAWVDKQAETSPNGPNLTVAITSASWAIPATLVEESTTLSENIAYFVGSGGSNGTDYPLQCTITYGITELSESDLTQTRTFTVKLINQ